MEFNLPRIAVAAAVTLLIGCAAQPAETPRPAQPAEAPVTPAPLPVREPLVLRSDYPVRYVVQPGDTLWDISAKYLRDPWRWPELWQKNPQIVNPHLIYPGDVLSLVYIDGRPTLQVQRSGTGTAEGGAYPTVKLSPQVRVQDLDRAIPTIPVDAIRQFLSRPQVLEPEVLEAAPYIVSSPDQHLIAGAGYQVYVRGIDSRRAEYVVLREAKTFVDPDTEEVLGVQTTYVGDARVERFGDPATVRLLRTQREALVGDRLLPPTDQALVENFEPRAPQQPVDGRIISLVDGVSQVGQFQVVVLNRGIADGLELGHVLAVYQSGDEVRDTVSGGYVQLPAERAGVVMVFRPFQHVSYALVMQATRPVRLHDQVANP